MSEDFVIKRESGLGMHEVPHTRRTFVDPTEQLRRIREIRNELESQQESDRKHYEKEMNSIKVPQKIFDKID